MANSEKLRRRKATGEKQWIPYVTYGRANPLHRKVQTILILILGQTLVLIPR